MGPSTIGTRERRDRWSTNASDATMAASNTRRRHPSIVLRGDGAGRCVFDALAGRDRSRW